MDCNYSQLTALNLVYFYLSWFYIFITYGILSSGFSIYTCGWNKNYYFGDLLQAVLAFDLLQLTSLLYLTLGISNPFLFYDHSNNCLFYIIKYGNNYNFRILTNIFVWFDNFHHFSGIHDSNVTFPELYLIGYFLAIVVV